MQVAAWSAPPYFRLFEVVCVSNLSPLYLRQQGDREYIRPPTFQALSCLLHTDRLPLWARPCAVATWEAQVSADDFTVY